MKINRQGHEDRQEIKTVEQEIAERTETRQKTSSLFCPPLSLFAPVNFSSLVYLGVLVGSRFLDS